MPRPQLDGSLLTRLEEAVDARTKVPVEHLTNSQRLAFVLDELEEQENKIATLEEEVDRLENQLEEAQVQEGTAVFNQGPHRR